MLRLSTATAAAIALHATEHDWIVFVQCQPPCGMWPIKIEGIAGKKLIDRLRDLAIDNPFGMFLVGLVQTFQPRDVEKALHQDFGTDELHDGWFSPTAQLLAMIENSAQGALQDLLAQTQPGGLDDNAVGVEEIAELLDVSVPTVRRMVKDERIPFMRFGRILRFVPKDVLASLGEQGR